MDIRLRAKLAIFEAKMLKTSRSTEALRVLCA